MGLTGAAAVGYAALCGASVLFLIALVAGAPWGALTQGGRTAGALPAARRAVAAASALLVTGMAGGILSAAGLWPRWPDWTGWGALALTGLSVLLNAITPSRAERRLWLPVTGAMLAFALPVLLG